LPLQRLLRHALERLRQALRHEWQLALRPNLGIRLERLLDLGVKGARLERDDLGRRVRVVRDWGAALGAEDAVHVLARRTLLRVGLGRTFDGELVFGDDGYKGCSASGGVVSLGTVFC